MKIRQALPLVLILGPVPGLAEVGDMHTVKVENAIVREGPGKDSAQLDKLSSGAEVMEMDVQGEWYEIYVASTDVGGWMHVSTMELLGGGTPPAAPVAATAPSAPTAEAKPATASAPAPAAAPSSTAISMTSQGKKSPGMKQFEKYLLKYNVRTKALKGYIPFTNAEDVGNGELHLTVSNQWLDKPQARQKSSLITLYTRWKKANNSSDVRIFAVDASGNKITQYPRQ